MRVVWIGGGEQGRGEVNAVGIGAKDWRVIRELWNAGIRFDSAVFNGGFLIGSNMLDYREADPERDAAAFAFRDRYLALCRRFRSSSIAYSDSSPKMG